MLLLGCRACLFVAAAVAALAVMDASGNGGALLSRRWPPSDAEIKVLESKLGYFFKEKWTLRLALIHPSFGEMNNARLTWLGDAVLGAAVSDLLYQGLPPNATTEVLHNRRMALVRQEACAVGAKQLGLDGLLVVSRGYEGQAPTTHMLAEAFEAVWGALYEDAGFQLAPVKETYARLFPVEGSGVLAGVEAALPTSMPAGANGSGLDA